MSNEKNGCTVSVSLEGLNEENETISRVDIKWFGLSRDVANLAQMDLINSINERVAKWNSLASGTEKA